MKMKLFNEGVGSNGKMITVANVDATAGKRITRCGTSDVVARLNKQSFQASLG